MIGKLTGTVDSYGEDSLILDVGGVGYEVHVPVRTLTQLPQVGERVTVWIETYLREDMIRLYGFATDLDREWFRLLQTVQGVGARVALAILGVLKAGEVATAIALQDKATLGRAPGVGKKLAERIVSELRDKAPKYASADPNVVRLRTDLAEHRAPRAIADAVSALTNLGYPEVQASAAVAAAARAATAGGSGGEATAEQLIRAGLKELAR
jgi:Holliday junction DNA helicase RuvA